MKELIRTGKTVEEAVNLALQEFGVPREMVQVEVLDEGGKGFLGLISKQAIVKVILKDVIKESAKNFLQQVIEAMKLDVKFDIEEDEDTIKFNLYGKNVGLLIGHRGETLDSLQYLVNVVASKYREYDRYRRIILDAENYRKRREETLIRLAKKLAKQVMETKESVELEPMSPNERRIIHMALQDHPYVETYSEGEEPNRRVIIALK
ncbi:MULTISPECIES: RNA-binding cell elongation regulator Jag/EloR [Thermoanaerobacter]|uniref:RNA-binding protein KhpB n=2 Tax=Thermoanaerobacter TaxID=1754 RepID=B0K8I0_THEP3|nr:MULTISPECIES: RNA-binding cell elongation regulator Jag/EloR [Thermoanaerobacter]ABY93669.1 single-stranded nucleic acid binding R3H domain protein [Thermoanaerobacter sp. X514]ABY95912.1 single-stranded nucleic acid binding R3H domain protein [Thermoanaerobacter pseudethanolicus ATCC 33223]ADV80838.1 single-stranded nucleic acid binding R3H domain-containing protein [Thermoanaerobacter brockii subsp. finnii Ako-1]HAA80916.1 protein jag [Thermoanaerobacter sp.]HBW59677.1 protein jag [Thermo